MNNKPTPSSQPQILIVDDEEGVRESLKVVLEDHYNLMTTDSGEQCLDCLKNAPSIKLVLLDIKMPQVNGLDVLIAVKRRFPDKKVIMVTGYRSVQTAQYAAGEGADGYIVKPFKGAEILEKVGKNL